MIVFLKLINEAHLINKMKVSKVTADDTLETSMDEMEAKLNLRNVFPEMYHG